ncbi:hypothetical protein N9A94_00780 [Akkermansiaceae bacterium]|nr:hypothetical protein [Akkermansiaceae bacterium]
MIVFSGFDALPNILKEILRWRVRCGATAVFWCWGYHTKQQCQGKFERGKTPLWAKKIATKIKRYTLKPFLKYYIVFGEAEIEDSKLNKERCLQMPMGRPQSAIMDACDSLIGELDDFKNESLSYIGRGNWNSKGIGKIVAYSNSENGFRWLYRFFVSAKESGFEEQVKRNEGPRLEWYYDVRGDGNLPWLRKSGAFLTINRNPTQIRTPYEALYSGTPIVMCREGMMDGFHLILEPLGLGDAVQTVTAQEFDDMSFSVRTLSSTQRAVVAETMKFTLDADRFARWLGEWLQKPVNGRSYYQEIKNTLVNRMTIDRDEK